MKKTCITLVAAATLFTLSCKKEDNQISNNHNKPNSGISEADAKLERSLQNFISKVKNYNSNKINTRTASNEMSLDSSEFYVEAGINYLNASNQITYEKQYANEQILTLTKNTDGTVDFSEVANMYLEAQNKISTFLNTILEADKKVAFVNLVKLPNGGNGDVESYKILTLVITPWNSLISYYNGGSWIAGGGLGNCFGADLGRDAATELTKNVTAQARNLAFQVEGHEFYYTNVISTKTLEHTDIGAIGRLILRGCSTSNTVTGSTGPSICISQETMNEYIQKGLQIATNCTLYTTGQTRGKIPFNFFYKVNNFSSSLWYAYEHTVKITYGELHVRLKKTSSM